MIMNNIIKTITVVDYCSFDCAIKSFKKEKGRNPYLLMNKSTFETIYNSNIKIYSRFFNPENENLRGHRYISYLYLDSEIFITPSVDYGKVELI